MVDGDILIVGQLTLVQISTMSGQVYIFDVQSNQALFTAGRLKDLLQSENIIKVFGSDIF